MKKLIPFLFLVAGCNIEKPFGPKMWCGTFQRVESVPVYANSDKLAKIEYTINGCFTWNPEEKGFTRIGDA